MLYNTVQVEVIKLGICNIEGLGLSSTDILIRSVAWLREKYEMFHEELYLQKAVWHIYAYLDLGFPYEEGQKEFQKILSHLKLTVEEVFPLTKWNYKKMPLSKTNVRNLLGKWNPRMHSMKITDAVEDIITKVAGKEEGEYTYYCGKMLIQEGEEALWEHTFRLYVRKQEAIFYDVNRNRHYIFV